MTILLTVIHVLVCVFLVIVVLLQSGKAADLAGAFGGMGSQTAFGPRGSATVLSKATTIAAGLFMLTSLTLAILATRGAATGSSVLQKSKAAAPQQQPQQQNSGTPAVPAPGAVTAQPGNPAASGAGGIQQPYVEVTPPGGGEPQRVPLDLSRQQQAKPGQQTPAPAQQPAKK